ncbi:PREDICTED: coiled-coil domain-containing protein 84 [Chrysochloris asiatica]|uniref:Coiled-coil domain-containing protein 84 n=1 Tax=Chrysochloris asiatica TaxID=185453 RepID=A0A9B0WHM4_CHRAS|nr:PREDICTED: coiled-coil domain-containing protein 84 [Chrysochloris asiatica]
MASAHHCPLCRQTFFCGRGHVYSRKHQRQLKAALERLLPQVEAARKAVRAAQVERYVSEHDRRCWCLCCGSEVRKHLSHGNLTVLHGGLLEHLASPEHKKATNRFWWENKAEVRMKDKFLISPQDYARFKKSMVRALDSYEEKEDEVIKEMAAQIREVENSRQEMVRSVLEPQAVPDPEEGCSKPTSWEERNRQISSNSQQPSDLDMPPTSELDWMKPGQPLTFIDHQDIPGVGNIHSGATPPWMVQDEEHDSESQQIGPSYEEFLKQKEKEKLKKLPPERVGANFDHSSSTNACWLPSFGRVWNNGRRWQSRHQFKTEARNKQQSRKEKT